jgi:putative hemolysin
MLDRTWEFVSGLSWGAWLVPLLPVFLAVSALCSSAETALFSMTHADRMRLRRGHPTTSTIVEAMLLEPRSLLIAMLLANVTSNTAYFTVGGMAGKRIFAEDHSLVFLFSAGCVLALIFFGEVLPKAIASGHRTRVTRVIALPIFLWFRLISPLRVLLDGFVIAPLARLFRPSGASSEPEQLTTQDLSNLLDVADQQGVLQEGEQQLLADVVQLGGLRVRDIMTPRVDVRWLDATATTQELLLIARETGFARFPVCRGGFNEKQLVGLVHAQRVLPQLAKQGVSARLPLTGLVEPPLYVPERSRVDQLLELFRTRAVGVAMVVNELGEVTGMVQVDNVLKQLMSFATGERDEGLPQVQLLEPGVWQVSGRLPVRDWEAFFEPGGVPRTTARVSTLAGLVLSRLGRVPKRGDEVLMGNLAMRIESMRGRMIELVRVTVRPTQPTPTVGEVIP